MASKEIGPREKRLREQREARFEASQKQLRIAEKLDEAHNRALISDLRESVAIAAKKTGKPKKRKAKKK